MRKIIFRYLRNNPKGKKGEIAFTVTVSDSRFLNRLGLEDDYFITEE